MSTIIDGLIYGWKKNLDYGQRLVADLSEDQMVAQPVCAGTAPVNHAAWVLSHLNVYLPIISSIIDKKPFDDPREHEFGMLSKPEIDRNTYAAKADLMGSFVAGHERVATQLAAADDSIFENDVMLPRWQPVMPRAGIALPYLMLLHENQHFGQISAWRRVLGLPSV